MKDVQKCLSTIATATLLGGASLAFGAAPNLSSASTFAVLGTTAVTCTTSLVVGDVGSGGTFANTGCTIAGAMPPATNPLVAGALADFQSARAALQAQSTSCIQMPGNLAGKNLAPGVYCLDAVAKAGTLTLTGSSTDSWVLLVNGALTGTSFTVVMAGGALPCNVYWSPTAAATMTDSAFKGNVLGGAGITITRGTFAGRAFATAAVTMTNGVVGCDVPDTTTGAPTCKDKDHDGDDDKDKAKDKDRDHSSDSMYPLGSKKDIDGKK